VTSTEQQATRESFRTVERAETREEVPNAYHVSSLLGRKEAIRHICDYCIRIQENHLHSRQLVDHHYAESHQRA